MVSKISDVFVPFSGCGVGVGYEVSSYFRKTLFFRRFRRCFYAFCQKLNGFLGAVGVHKKCFRLIRALEFRVAVPA